MNISDFNPTFDDVGGLLSALVQIGFEYEDVQLAIQNGKLTADEIIEWISTGKPPLNPPRQPVLKLNANSMDTSSNNSARGSADTSGFSADATSYGLERTPAVGAEDVPMVSRINRNEEQRQFKLRYEEKQREEAKKLAMQEKIAKKKAHEDALRRIQEDRENFRLRSLPSGSQPAPSGTGAAATVEAAAQNKPAADGNSTILQIRLTDGRCLKQSFAAEARLREVKEFVENTYYSGQEVILLQPFPRVEFGETDMNRQLRELGIVPSGSLVVKKPVAGAEMQLDASQAVNDGESNGSSSAEPPRTPGPLGSVPPNSNVQSPPVAPASQPPVNHQWGSGQMLVDDPPDPSAEGQDEQEMETDSDEDPSIQAPPPQQNPPQQNPPQQPPQQPHFPAVFPPHNPGFPGGGFGGFGGGHHGHMPIQHDWGFGNVLAGPFLDNVILPHQNKDPRAVAGEAATLRRAQPPQPEPSRSLATVFAYPDVSSLRDIVLKSVAVFLCDPRKPIVGLHGIPENLAFFILNALIKERFLKPATLDMFISCRMQKIVLDSYIYCTNELLRAIRHHIYLKHLSLKSCSLITEKGLQSLAGLKFLKSLNLAGCVQLDDKIFPILSAITSLAALTLDGTSITDAGIVAYANAAPANLVMLDLSRTQVTEAIFPSLSNIPSLNNLVLEQMKIKSLAGIQNLVKLVRLNVANTQIITESMICLASLPSLACLNCANTVNVNGDVAVGYISGLPLREFHLPNRLTTTDIAIRHIAGMKLTELDLSNFIYITDESMPFVGRLKQLKKLLLSNTKITDVGVKHLEGLTALEELDLDRTAVTNAISSTIRVFTSLRELSLCNTRITNGFLTTGAVNQCVELTRLNLSQTMISDKGIVYLQLPYLSTLKVDRTYITSESVETVRIGCPLLGNYTFQTLLPLPRDQSELN